MKHKVTYNPLPPCLEAPADAAERLQQAIFRYPEQAKGSEPTRTEAWAHAEEIIAKVSRQPGCTPADAMDTAATELNRIAHCHGYRKPAFRDQTTRAEANPGPPMPSDGAGRTFIWDAKDPQPLRDLQAARKFADKANGPRRGRKVNEHKIGRWMQARRKAEQVGMPINESGTLTADQLALPEVADALAADLLERQQQGKKTLDPWRLPITQRSGQRRELTNGSRHSIQLAGRVIDMADADMQAASIAPPKKTV